MTRPDAPSAPAIDVDPRQAPAAAASAWSRPIRRVASLLIVLHLAAVFIAPFAFACTTESGSSSPFADTLMGCFRPYIDLMYLNHGYSFFAPNVGASHLVRYRIEFDDGRESIEGVFPDLRTQRPRLLYHRHFMLAEALQNAYVPPEEPREMLPDSELESALSAAQQRELAAERRQLHVRQVVGWERGRNAYLSLRRSLEEHLASVHGGGRVTLTRVEHAAPSPAQFNLLPSLSAPRSFVDLPEGRTAPRVERP